MDTEKFISKTEGQCQFFVVRKKRLCRMGAPPGRGYCPEHEPQPLAEDQDSARIPCPLDPKHTCYAHKLAKHLLVCNGREGEQPAYIVKDINKCGHHLLSARVPLTQVPQTVLSTVIQKVHYLYEKHVKIEEAYDPDSNYLSETEQLILRDATERRGGGAKGLRHARQAARLMRLAEESGLVQPHTCYLDLGAGKGELAYCMWLAWCQAHQGRGSVAAAVEVAARRHKRDGRAAGAISRLRADLTHLALVPWIHGPDSPFANHPINNLETSQHHDDSCKLKKDHEKRKSCSVESSPPLETTRRENQWNSVGQQPLAVVGLAKHLCGVATDYALSCMVSALAPEKAEPGQEVLPGGLVMATCCHHRCQLPDYVGLPYLKELGLTEEELNAMLGVVSWAVCGDGLSRVRRAGGGLSPAARSEREGAGRAAKALLDWGRVLRLRALGLRARLCRYAPPADSPENLCIVATSF